MTESLIDFVQWTIDGGLTGILYGLIALSFIVIFRTGKIFNFAQGEVVVLGGYFVYTFYSMLSFPLWLSVLAAFVSMGIVGLLVERVILRPLIGQELFTTVMSTIALIFILQGFTIAIWGGIERPFPTIFKSEAISFGGFLFSRSVFMGGILSIAIIALLFLLMERTRWGLKLTAVAEDHQIAQSLGISVKKSIATGWVISCVLSSFAAIVFLNNQAINFSASMIGLNALPVALLGGVESLWGAPVAGLIVGVGTAWTAFFLDPYTEGTMSKIFPFILMVGILLIRPHGLFGWKVIERV